MPKERHAVFSVDAGFDSSSDTILYAIVIRDEHGEILLIQCLTTCIQFWKRFEPFEAKAEPTRKDIQLTNEKKAKLGYDKFVVESDSKEGIRWVSN